jgi:DNA polymerase IV
MAPRKSTSKSIKSFGDTPVTSTNVPATNTEHLLFSGLHFYFFPNSRTNRARAIRIDKASEHGAIFCPQLNPKVSHIIMDDGMHWDEFTKYHKTATTLPENVIIVNGRYVADCLSYGIVLAHEQRVYQVPGRSPESGEASKLRRIASAPSLVDKVSHANSTSLQRANTEQIVQKAEPLEATQEYNSIVEVIGRGPTASGKAKAAATDGLTESADEVHAYEDDLSAMISEAKATAHLVS